MKKLALAVVALAWSNFAFAGEYHVFTKLICSDCHTMHTSRSHAFDGSGTAPGAIGKDGDATGHDKLLVGTSVNDTCLSCHDNQAFAPDVFGTDANAGSSAVRSAGALNGTIGSHSDSSYDTYMGHTMGSTVTPPGLTTAANWSTAEEFNCSDCHGVHGNNNYRNLGNKYGATQAVKDAGAAVVTYVVGSFDPTYDVTIAAGNDRTVGFSDAKYATTNITFGVGGPASYPGVTGAPAQYGMNRFCAGCHGNFHGTATTDTKIVDQTTGDYIRHPTSTANRQIGTSGTNGTIGSAATALVRPLWKTATTGATGTFDVGCLTCHKGHGNKNGFGLLLPGNNDATTAIGARTTQTAVTNYENGDSAQNAPVRALCITCHGQGQTNSY